MCLEYTSIDNDQASEYIWHVIININFETKTWLLLIIHIKVLATPTSRFNDTNDENEWTA